MSKSYKNSRCPITFDNELFVPISKLLGEDIIPYYYVSNYGRIYSTASQRFVSGSIDPEGYVEVTLHTYSVKENNLRNQITRRVNRIVLLSFLPIGNYENLEVHHINHNRSDNRLINLMWTTAKENTDFSIQYGYRRFVDVAGENNPMAILTNDQVIEIKDMVRSREYMLKDIAGKYGISMTALYSIINNITWKGIGGYINPEDIRVSNAITNEEFNAICTYLDTHDINNKEIYPSMNKLLIECYNSCGLDQKYGLFENKRKMMVNILKKNCDAHNIITSKYKYKYIY